MVIILTELINPLNAELNPICHLLALLGAHHILHIGRIRVKQYPDFKVHCHVLSNLRQLNPACALMQYCSKVHFYFSPPLMSGSFKCSFHSSFSDENCARVSYAIGRMSQLIILNFIYLTATDKDWKFL